MSLMGLITMVGNAVSIPVGLEAVEILALSKRDEEWVCPSVPCYGLFEVGFKRSERWQSPKQTEIVDVI
jgi:hypothetical protein